MIAAFDTGELSQSSQSRSSLMDELSIFTLAEETIMAAAARNIDDPMRQKLQEAFFFEKRCAIVGDVEGMLAADAAVELLICIAAGAPDAAAELQTMKQHFKHLWSNHNRLRDATPDVTHREHQIASVLAGDEVAAVAAVRRFYKDVRSRI